MTWNSVLRNMNEKNKHSVRKRAAVVLSVLSVLCLAVFSSGCAGKLRGADQETKDGPGQDDRLRVVTTIFPPYDFVREIAGDRADLKMLLKPGEESHSYEHHRHPGL